MGMWGVGEDDTKGRPNLMPTDTLILLNALVPVLSTGPNSAMNDIFISLNMDMFLSCGVQFLYLVAVCVWVHF